MRKEEEFFHPLDRTKRILQRTDHLGLRDVIFEAEQIAQINKELVLTALPNEKMSDKPPPAAKFSTDQLVKAYLARDTTITPSHFKNVNTFVPDFSLLEIAAAYAFDQAQTSSYFRNEFQTTFHLKNDTLYHMVLAKIFTLKQMSTAGIASIDQMRIVEDFFHTFSEDTLPVISPLIPFYQSLNTCETKVPYHGIICPAIPSVSSMQFTAANFQLAPYPLFSLIPNIVGLIRMHRQLASDAQLAIAANYVHDCDLWDNDRPAAANAGNDVWVAHNNQRNPMLMWRRWQPGFIIPTTNFKNNADFNAYRHSPMCIRPPLIDIANDIANEHEEMGFNNQFYWFNDVLQHQIRYARYWEGSTTIKKILQPSTGSGIYRTESAWDNIYPMQDQFNAIDQAVNIPADNGNNAVDINDARLHRCFNYLQQLRNQDANAPIHIRLKNRCVARDEYVHERMLEQLATATNHYNVVTAIGDRNELQGRIGTTQGPFWNRPIDYTSSTTDHSLLRNALASPHLAIQKPDDK